MRVGFCMFTNADGVPVYVNPSLVRYFLSHDHALTKIVFDNEDVLFVKASPLDVENGLRIDRN